MDREQIYASMAGEGRLDYEKYLNTPKLLSCQKPYEQLCNADELQFQIVHQSEELWMKLICYTLLEIDERMAAGETFKVLTLFARVHKAMGFLIEQLSILDTMSIKDYQAIRLQLGNGSGQESPGFKTLLQLYKPLWLTFERVYLEQKGQTVEQIYNSEYRHDESYMVAEAMIEYDQLFQHFRYHHIKLIHRSIGIDSMSLKGRSTEILNSGMKMQFFPKLWQVRGQMTDIWGGVYGVKRDSIAD
ncbi:tryptophan 2,3-dioxygenase family protein [Shewanella algae]|uniref:tryptophan 2,3-dioxygenase family protein n=1 Tax=Shewanella algae TaxID=38313 RepID=UPI001AAD62DA|nr:tryptophan 2,3-dioxygenase family protein [Shewanella algae]MBO2555892.1 tryptophan 2,3-dioxygenase [Shewanella algae]MBO2572825.1 tryptophan 2,3-dioxygenase [Shewanella algae]MBO2648920.1 tryptophan 2,3-dioxygenase [Shewanella algae]BCV48597.1 tryptophan 2,3-dioxygenase [Shewanella algae]